MGSVLVSSKQEHGTDRGAPLFSINKPITSLIGDVIKDEIISEELTSFPDDLIRKCAQFIGFFLYSSIVSEQEALSLHLLLFEHQKRYRLINKSQLLCISYYDLLYRSSVNGENGKYTNRSFKLALDEAYTLNKSKLVIIYETEHNHVFAVYLHRRLKQNKKGDFTQNIDRDIAGFLLRSRYKDCPRMIEFKDRNNYMSQSQLLWSNERKIHLFEISFFYAKNISKQEKQALQKMNLNCNFNEHYRIDRSRDLDISGQELLGCKSDTFNLKQVEMYQILYD